MDTIFLFKGLLLGFSIAAPVGPIGVLCIRRTLERGILHGFASGVGAATADAFYGSVAAFGLTVISDILLANSLYLRIAGSFFLFYLGCTTFVAKPAEKAARAQEGSVSSAYFSTVFLTITNPMTILAFGAVFAGLGVNRLNESGGFSAVLLVVGVFCGSSLWWLLLSGTVNLFRAKFDYRQLIWVNRLSGSIILGFGFASLLLL